MVGKLSQRAMDSDYLDTTSVVVLYINTVYLSEIFPYCFWSRLRKSLHQVVLCDCALMCKNVHITILILLMALIPFSFIYLCIIILFIYLMYLNVMHLL